MTTDAAYKIYTVLRLHFTTDRYDIRSGVKPKAPKNGIRKNFSINIEKILRKYNHNTEMYMEYLISNFVNGDKWGGVFSADGDDIYLAWKKTQESLTYIFRQEIEQLSEQYVNITEVWDCTHGHPDILKLYYGKRCHLETLVILNKLYKFRDVVNKELQQDPAWESVNRLLQKYSPFINIDKEKFSMITNKVFA